MCAAAAIAVSAATAVSAYCGRLSRTHSETQPQEGQFTVYGYTVHCKAQQYSPLAYVRTKGREGKAFWALPNRTAPPPKPCEWAGPRPRLITMAGARVTACLRARVYLVCHATDSSFAAYAVQPVS